MKGTRQQFHESDPFLSLPTGPDFFLIPLSLISPSLSIQKGRSLNQLAIEKTERPNAKELQEFQFFDQFYDSMKSDALFYIQDYR